MPSVKKTKKLRKSKPKKDRKHKKGRQEIQRQGDIRRMSMVGAGHYVSKSKSKSKSTKTTTAIASGESTPSYAKKTFAASTRRASFQINQLSGSPGERGSVRERGRHSSPGERGSVKERGRHSSPVFSPNKAYLRLDSGGVIGGDVGTNTRRADAVSLLNHTYNRTTSTSPVSLSAVSRTSRYAL